MQRKAKVVLYTKPGCGLCAEMKMEIRKAACDDLYTFTEVDIESDAELFAAYQYEIPVLFINDVEAFRHRLIAYEFKRHIIDQNNSGKCSPEL